jgi:predicted outer membrane protein
MKRLSTGLLIAAVAVLWVGLARAERETDRGGTGPGSEPRGKASPPGPAMFAAGSVAHVKRMSPEQREERRFLRDAAASSRFESDASRLALGKSTNPAVRSFATTLMEHHATASTDLYHLLHGRGMAPPMLENAQRKTLNRLARLQGAKFDREYMEAVGSKHQNGDVQLYERAAVTAEDATLKAWVARNLPTVRDHATLAARVSSGADTRLTKSQPGGLAKRVSAGASESNSR